MQHLQENRYEENTRKTYGNQERLGYQEFCENLKPRVLKNPAWKLSPEDYKFYPDGYTAEKSKKDKEFIHSTNIKYHGVVSDVLMGDYIALMLHTAGEAECMCRFSVKYLFDEYMEGGWERVERILQENISLASNANLDYVLKHLEEYDFVKERLIIRPINYSDNKLELSKHIYKVFGDIALVLYATLYDDKRGWGTVKMPKDSVEAWGKDVETIFEEALINTYALAQPRMYTNPWDTITAPAGKGAFMSVNTAVEPIENKRWIPLVTTTKKTNGAIAMFYPGVKEKIAELFESNYYVAFTSIHEARVHHCDYISPEQVKDSLDHVNMQFDKNEILSRMVFYYDAEKKTLEPLQHLNK